eukprot:12922973-Prorocentrum_lima.AAC.1
MPCSVGPSNSSVPSVANAADAPAIAARSSQWRQLHPEESMPRWGAERGAEEKSMVVSATSRCSKKRLRDA